MEGLRSLRHWRAGLVVLFRLQKACPGVVSSGEPSRFDLDRCRSLGRALAEAALNRVEEPRG